MGLEANDALISAEPFAVQELAHDVAQKYKLEVEKNNSSIGPRNFPPMRPWSPAISACWNGFS